MFSPFPSQVAPLSQGVRQILSGKELLVEHGLSSLHVELLCKYEESWPASYMKERCVGKESVCGRHASYSGQDCEEVTPRCPQDDRPSPHGLNSS